MEKKPNVIPVKFPRQCNIEQLANESAKSLLPYLTETHLDDDEALLALFDGLRRAWTEYAGTNLAITDFKIVWEEYSRDCLGLTTDQSP